MTFCAEKKKTGKSSKRTEISGCLPSGKQPFDIYKRRKQDVLDF